MKSLVTKKTSRKKIDEEKIMKLMYSIENDMLKRNYPIHYRDIINLIQQNKNRSEIWRNQLKTLSRMGNELNIIGDDYAVRQEKERRPKLKIISDRLLELNDDEISYIIPLIKEQLYDFGVNINAKGIKKSKTSKKSKKKKKKKSKKI